MDNQVLKFKSGKGLSLVTAAATLRKMIEEQIKLEQEIKAFEKAVNTIRVNDIRLIAAIDSFIGAMDVELSRPPKRPNTRGWTQTREYFEYKVSLKYQAVMSRPKLIRKTPRKHGYYIGIKGDKS